MHLMRFSGRFALLSAVAVPLALVSPGSASAVYEPYEPDLTWQQQIDLGFDDAIGSIDEADGVVWAVGRANPVNDGRGSAEILRLDEDGHVIDRITQGSGAGEGAAAVDAGPWGAVVVGGTGGVFPGADVVNDNYRQEGWAQLRDPDGAVVWTAQFGGAHVNYVGDVSVVGDVVVVVGSSYPSGRDRELQAWSLSLSSGELLAQRHLGTPGDDAFAASVAVGDAVVVGGVVHGELVEGSDHGERDALLVSLDPHDLTTHWVTQLGTVGDDSVGALAERDGTVYWAGALGRENDADYFTPSIGGVGAVSVAGEVQWMRRLGTTGSFVRTIAATSEGIVLGGGADPGELGVETAQFGGEDAFLQGRTYSGEVLWTEVYGGPSFDAFMGLSATEDRLLVSGVTYEGMFGRRDDEPASVLARFDVPHLLRPDLAVRSAGGRFIGGNGSTETVRLSVRAGHQRTTVLRLQDDGLLHDRLSLRSCATDGVLRLHFVDDGRDVTRAARAGRYRTPRLAPGRYERLELRIAAERRARGEYTCLLSTRSATDGRKTDRIELRIAIAR